jgi:hypothetical protein
MLADLKFPYDMEDSTLKILMKNWFIWPGSIKRQEKKVKKRIADFSARFSPELAETLYFNRESEKDREREIMIYAVDDLVVARFRQAALIILSLAVMGIISVLVALTTIGPALLIVWSVASLVIILVLRNLFRSYLEYLWEYLDEDDLLGSVFGLGNRRIFELVCDSMVREYKVDIWLPAF